MNLIILDKRGFGAVQLMKIFYRIRVFQAKEKNDKSSEDLVYYEAY